MCGIAGIYKSEKSDKNHLLRAIEAMNRSQKLRGPDDQGIFLDLKNNLAFGHNRLSIIDLSAAGHQPMQYRFQKSGDWRITFNGEIYNFKELKKDLEDKKYKFKTKTDTEVILALYAEYGEAAFQKLRGMFAFGLWDAEKKKVFLVKDRYGIKPLYYFSNSQALIFASTVKALIESGLAPVQKNPEAFIGFLLFGSVPLPLTTIKGVLAVPAGHYLVKEFGKAEELVRYYDPLPYFKEKQNIKFDQAVSAVRERLDESIDLHLISDAPLGVFLSGGLDSSAIAALAALKRENPITTLSIVFDEKDFSERPYQRMVAKMIKSDHREVKITAKDFLDSLESIFEAMDQPTIDGVNSYFVAKAAKSAGLKAVLSGLGSDEVFFGYPSFRRAGLARRIQQAPKFLKFGLGMASLLGDKYAKLVHLKNEDILSFYLGIRGLFSPKQAARMLGISLNNVNQFIERIFVEKKLFSSLLPADALSYMELRFYLQNQLLKDADFMSMRHSVEVRVPFLDHPLVEYLSSLPPKLKIANRINKPLLVRAVSDFLPPAVLERKKMGFTFPFAQWLKSAPVDLLPQRLPAQALIGQFRAGRLHWSRFWASLVLDKFFN